MIEQSLNGDQALAMGALASGISLAAGYPGSPSSGTVEALIGPAKKHGFYVEWSSNEKVALETGIGASIAGRRALICTKSVGLNVMIDSLMTLNLTPVHGGLVIVLGDDPGGYGSQNDQDSRSLAPFLEMPMMEPSGPAEAFSMIQEAYRISERYRTAVIIRETRSFSQRVEKVPIESGRFERANFGLAREPWRFVPVPINAVEKHRALHERIEALSGWANTSAYNRESGRGSVGIVCAGSAYRKLLDVVGEDDPQDFRLIKLGVLYPLPGKIIEEFLGECREILVLEESEPFVETGIKAIAHDWNRRVHISGKQNPHLNREGELFRWQIEKALADFLPGLIPKRRYSEENESEERPKKKNNCADCQYDKVLDKLEAAAESIGQKLLLIGDPGCLVTVADRLDAKYALGSAVGVADGLARAGIKERPVAVFGDSSFFHSTLPAVCNAAHNRSRIVMVLLDNKATATSGFQVNPGVGRDAMGHDVPALDIERIVRSCGVRKIFVTRPDELNPGLEETFRTALGETELTLVIVRLEAGRETA